MPQPRPKHQRLARAGSLIGLALLVSLTSPGCRRDETGPGALPPPMRLRSVYPDSTLVLDPSQSLDFVYTFNRSVDPDEYRMLLFPEPTDRGTMGPTGSGRTHELIGLQVSEGTEVLRALLLSPSLSVPVALHWFMTEDHPRAGIAGRVVLDPGGESIDPRGTLVFAFPIFTDFNPLDPSTLDTAAKSSVAVIEKSFSDGSGGQFVLEFLIGKPPFVPDRDAPPEARYILAAIKDTNEDLRFDADEDWWTYLHVPGDPDPTIVVAPDATVELVLHPPGWRP